MEYRISEMCIRDRADTENSAGTGSASAEIKG